MVRQTCYGLRVHVRLEWPGVITRFFVAPANAHELAALPALTEQMRGTLLGDRNYWSPATTAEWQPRGVEWLAPYRSAKRDPHPRWSTLLSRVRYRIDTVFGQFLSRDTYPGTSANPTSLNRFTYGNGDPALVTDPTGHLGLRDARNWVSNHANYSDVDVQVCGACIGNTVGVRQLPSPDQVRRPVGPGQR